MRYDASRAHPGQALRPALQNLRGLAEFAVVARWEHMTRAAEELGVPQPTLSRRIARLEQELGLPLFTRRGRSLALTRPGRHLAAVVEEALLALDRGLDDVVRAVDPDSGTVTLAFLNTLGVAVVPRLLRELRRHHPALRVQLAQDGHDAVLDRVRRGEADAALTAPLPHDPDLTAVPLHRQALCLSVPSTHPLARRRRVALADAASEQFVGFKPGLGMRGITEQWCRRAGFTPQLAFEGEDVATVRGLVAVGLGVALLPVASEPPDGVVELTVHDLPLTRTIALVSSARRAPTPPADTFQRFLATHGARLVAEGAAGRL